MISMMYAAFTLCIEAGQMRRGLGVGRNRAALKATSTNRSPFPLSHNSREYGSSLSKIEMNVVNSEHSEQRVRALRQEAAI